VVSTSTGMSLFQNFTVQTEKNILNFFEKCFRNVHLDDIFLGDDEETLDYIESEMSKAGITQDLIDETRAATETRMLKDLQELASRGEDLEVPDKNGATPVSFIVNLCLK
jgi:hypothetical protein